MFITLLCIFPAILNETPYYSSEKLYRILERTSLVILKKSSFFLANTFLDHPMRGWVWKLRKAVSMENQQAVIWRGGTSWSRQGGGKDCGIGGKLWGGNKEKAMMGNWL
jgi:hypothetical protein